MKMIEQEQSLLNEPVVDRCLGSLFGSFIGDSLGSYCQFQPEQTEEQMDIVMEMRGGGTYQIKPGQITDDSEMALHLLRALSQFDQSRSLDAQVAQMTVKIATQYTYWLRSQPFDIGNTCLNALNIINRQRARNKQLSYEIIKQKCFPAIAQKNHASLSNGSLMRIVPMAIFKSLLENYSYLGSEVPLNELLKNEINMTHGNPLILECGKQWIQLLSQLIIRQDDQISTLHQILNNFLDNQNSSDELKLWKEQGLKKQLMKASVNQGYSKIAVSYGIHELKSIIEKAERDQRWVNSDTQYINSIRKTIQKGGDSDTNGAIVGGLLGAAVGFKNLPMKYVEKQLNLSLPKMPTLQTFQRYQFYEPKSGLKHLLRMIKKMKR